MLLSTRIKIQNHKGSSNTFKRFGAYWIEKKNLNLKSGKTVDVIRWNYSVMPFKSYNQKIKQNFWSSAPSKMVDEVQYCFKISFSVYRRYQKTFSKNRFLSV